MRDLPSLGAFDLVWCLDDALNYLLDPDELRLTFEGLRRNLAPDGLVLFDCNAVGAYRWFWADSSEIEGDPPLTWTGLAGPDFAPGEIAEAVLEFDGERIVHRQRHHPHETRRADARRRRARAPRRLRDPDRRRPPATA